MSDKKVLVFISNGTEEVEVLSVVDVLRRGNVEVNLCSATGENLITSSHNVKILTDSIIEDINVDEYDCVVIPGGIPGASNLRDNEKVIDTIKKFNVENKICAAMCAGPIALAKADVVNGKKATSFPADPFSNPLKEMGALYSQNIVETDSNIITARGPATAIYFGLSILENLTSKDKRDEVAKGLLVPLVEEHILKG